MVVACCPRARILSSVSIALKTPFAVSLLRVPLPSEYNTLPGPNCIQHWDAGHSIVWYLDVSTVSNATTD
eukprot:8316484-Pyramimonas_sp.AAC.1